VPTILNFFKILPARIPININEPIYINSIDPNNAIGSVIDYMVSDQLLTNQSFCNTNNNNNRATILAELNEPAFYAMTRDSGSEIIDRIISNYGQRDSINSFYPNLHHFYDDNNIKHIDTSYIHNMAYH
jgi:hypothetical protein